jgi:superoxide dismutase, Fe-Mn family
MNRRDALRTLAIGAGGFFVPNGFSVLAQTDATRFALPALGYAFDALEPHIDAQTMQLHHDKHHGAAVANLNAALAKHPEFKLDLEEMLTNLARVPDDIRVAVRNNAGSHWNHSFFWKLITPGGARQPGGALGGGIDFAFGHLNALREQFAASASARFGSGWAWLVVNRGKLEVISTPNQDTPLELGARAVLGVDVWEHAYYLKYQNRRADYLNAWWNTINWDVAAANYVAARK